MTVRFVTVHQRPDSAASSVGYIDENAVVWTFQPERSAFLRNPGVTDDYLSEQRLTLNDIDPQDAARLCREGKLGRLPEGEAWRLDLFSTEPILLPETVLPRRRQASAVENAREFLRRLDAKPGVPLVYRVYSADRADRARAAKSDLLGGRVSTFGGLVSDGLLSVRLEPSEDGSKLMLLVSKNRQAAEKPAPSKPRQAAEKPAPSKPREAADEAAPPAQDKRKASLQNEKARVAMGGIRTYNEDGVWKSKVEGSSRAAHTGGTKAEQRAIGREMANERGVEHTISKLDGRTGRKNSRRRDPNPPKE